MRNKKLTMGDIKPALQLSAVAGGMWVVANTLVFGGVLLAKNVDNVMHFFNDASLCSPYTPNNICVRQRNNSLDLK